MRPLVVTTFLTMDGVMQAPGGPGEDPAGGFSYEGWLVPHFDDVLGAQIEEWFAPVEDFLLGRTTYDIFYASWPKMRDESSAVATGLNDKIKHVASRTLTSVEWETARLLENPVADAVRTLKDRDGGELQVHGSAGLVQTLLHEDLVDELRLVVAPVVVGAGKRLFGEGTVPRTWRLTLSKTTPTGVLIAAYQRAGEVEIGTMGPEYEE
ncbi:MULTISPECIES: dihydrofolate reductase family protein [unclassified Geodermatophilus]|uniref:dihydrofolate reductase family protein n=1 Tax=unclassified Geodermatophilus TaxID=2637632 RepID=UPI003EEF8184